MHLFSYLKKKRKKESNPPKIMTVYVKYCILNTEERRAQEEQIVHIHLLEASDIIREVWERRTWKKLTHGVSDCSWALTLFFWEGTT